MNDAMSGLYDPHLWAAFGEITLINILLSGDNAVVIALACRGLPPRQRRWGIMLGAGVACALRIVFALVVTTLMALPYLKIAGAIALLWVAVKLLDPVEAHAGQVEATGDLWRAVRTVFVADLVMSLDNVIAVAAAAKGHYVLLGLGLVMSLPIVVAGSAVTLWVLKVFPLFVWIGAGLLGWIAGDILADDQVLVDRFGAEKMDEVDLYTALGGTALVLGLGLWRRQRRNAAPA